MYTYIVNANHDLTWTVKIQYDYRDRPQIQIRMHDPVDTHYYPRIILETDEALKLAEHLTDAAGRVDNNPQELTPDDLERFVWTGGNEDTPF